MAKIDVYCKIKKRNMRIDEKIAKVLVRAKRAEYLTKPVVEYQNRMMVPALPKEPEKQDNKLALKAILDAAGVEYDGRLGEAKLQELVDSLGKDE
jgi:hypothetical protein